VKRARRPNSLDLDDDLVAGFDGDDGADGSTDFTQEDLEAQLESGFAAPEEALHVEDVVNEALLDEDDALLENDVAREDDELDWAVAEHAIEEDAT
jgi:hypothetical protein